MAPARGGSDGAVARSEVRGRALLCPSAQAGMPGCRVLGVVAGTAAEPRLAHLEEPIPATPEILSLAGPVKPTEVFRLAAPCVEKECRHFDGKDCHLASRIVQILPAVTES